MRATYRFSWAIALAVVAAVAPLRAAVPPDPDVVVAPFPMRQFVRPVFPSLSLSIEQTGAVEGRLSTAAIQNAIDRVAAAGGGTVIVPAGRWLTGRLVMRSHINLRIDEGAELRFSGDVADYLPAVAMRYEGVDVLGLGAMIYADSVESIAITGRGRLVGPGQDCEIARRQAGGIRDEEARRPMASRLGDGSDGGKVYMPVFFGPMRSREIWVEGVTFEQGVFWNIVPCYCSGIVIRDVTVVSYGHGRTDGIDLDSSTDALIEYVTLDCGDDCFTLKSGRGDDGLRRHRPTANVVIRHCTVRRGVGGIAVGSETAGGVRNVYAHDCTMQQPMFPIYLKTRRPRGGGAEGLYFERISVDTCRTAVMIDMLGSEMHVGAGARRFPAPAVKALTPRFADIHISDLTVGHCATLIRAKGLPEQPIDSLIIERVASPERTVSLQDVATFTFR